MLGAIAVYTCTVSCEKKEQDAGGASTDVAKVEETPLEAAKGLLAKLASGLEKTVVALEGVTDKASAESAAKTIKEVSEELKALGPQGEKMKDSLSEEEQKAMEESAMATMKPLMGRMTDAMQKAMSDPEAAAVLAPVMQEFSQAMSPPRAPAPTE